MSGTVEDYSAYVKGSWPRLFRTAYALTGEVAAAEDLLQTTLVRVYVSWRRVVRAENPDAYVRRMLVNQATSYFRSRSRRPEVLVAEPRKDGPTPAPEVDDELWELVQGLPARQRAVLVLRYYEDLSEKEIASTLGIAPGTVKSQCSSALARLRRELAPVTTEGGRA